LPEPGFRRDLLNVAKHAKLHADGEGVHWRWRFCGSEFARSNPF
jgi:hypothetical protein